MKFSFLTKKTADLSTNTQADKLSKRENPRKKKNSMFINISKTNNITSNPKLSPPSIVVEALQNFENNKSVLINKKKTLLLSFKKGDLFQVLNFVGEEYYKVCNPLNNENNIGYVYQSMFKPFENVTPTYKNGFLESETSYSNQTREYCFGSVLYDFKGIDIEELNVSKGENIKILAFSNDEWVLCSKINKELNSYKCHEIKLALGLVPISYLKIYIENKSYIMDNETNLNKLKGLIPSIQRWKQIQDINSYGKASATNKENTISDGSQATNKSTILETPLITPDEEKIDMGRIYSQTSPAIGSFGECLEFQRIDNIKIVEKVEENGTVVFKIEIHLNSKSTYQIKRNCRDIKNLHHGLLKLNQGASDIFLPNFLEKGPDAIAKLEEYLNNIIEFPNVIQSSVYRTFFRKDSDLVKELIAPDCELLKIRLLYNNKSWRFCIADKENAAEKILGMVLEIFDQDILENIKIMYITDIKTNEIAELKNSTKTSSFIKTVDSEEIILSVVDS